MIEPDGLRWNLDPGIEPSERFGATVGYDEYTKLVTDPKTKLATQPITKIAAQALRDAALENVGAGEINLASGRQALIDKLQSNIPAVGELILLPLDRLSFTAMDIVENTPAKPGISEVFMSHVVQRHLSRHIRLKGSLGQASVTHVIDRKTVIVSFTPQLGKGQSSTEETYTWTTGGINKGSVLIEQVSKSKYRGRDLRQLREHRDLTEDHYPAVQSILEHLEEAKRR